MINITPINQYNTNFRAKTDYSKIYKQMETITLKQEELIRVKNGSKRVIKNGFFKGLRGKFLDILFSLKLLKPTDKKYDKYGNLRLKKYEQCDSYIKYDYNIYPYNPSKHCLSISEIKYPSGTHKYYGERGVAFLTPPLLIKKTLPDGTTIHYTNNKNDLFDRKRYVEKIVLPNGTTEYYQNGNHIKTIDANGNVIESHLYEGC